MVLVSLVGPNAAGKSTVAEQVSGEGELFPIHYRDHDVLSLDNRLVLSKWSYIAAWFAGVFDAKRRGARMLVTDRSPFDTAAYIRRPASLVAPVKASTAELADLGIKSVFIHLSAPLDILQIRVNERLRLQPWRNKYHELELLPQAVRFFDAHQDLWHHRFDTSRPLNEVVTEIRTIITMSTDGVSDAKRF